jgi:hypothetical protein
MSRFSELRKHYRWAKAAEADNCLDTVRLAVHYQMLIADFDELKASAEALQAKVRRLQAESDARGMIIAADTRDMDRMQAENAALRANMPVLARSATQAVKLLLLTLPRRSHVFGHDSECLFIGEVEEMIDGIDIEAILQRERVKGMEGDKQDG